MWPFSNHKGYPKRLIVGFVCAALVGSVVSGLFLIDRFRSYRAEIDVILLAKSAQGALEMEATRDMLVLFGDRADFFSNVNDAADVDEISLVPVGKGSIRVSVISVDPIDARDGAVATAQELFSWMSRYYDVRTNIDIRSLGRPHAEGFIGHPIVFLVSALFSGVFFALIFFFALLSIAHLVFSFHKKEPAFPVEKKQEKQERTEPIHTFPSDTFIPKKVDAKFFSFEPMGTEREKDYAHFNRGPAPTNLPVADDEADAFSDFLFEEQSSPDDDTADETRVMSDAGPIAPLPINHEPTAEEYKRRLNDLLKGKMPQ